jgi:ketosteroid isomerase-like protein
MLNSTEVSSSVDTRALLEAYYDGLSRNADWDSVLSDDVVLTGTVARESKGKEQFVNNNFFRMVQSLTVKRLIVENENACAIVNYDLLSPNGKAFSSDIAEVWRAKDGRLEWLAIYFDTAQFQKETS